MANWVASGPGSNMQKLSACKKCASLIHLRFSTSSVCMRAIWPVGPPKLMNPSLSQNPTASANSGTVVVFPPTPPTLKPQTSALAHGILREYMKPIGLTLLSCLTLVAQAAEPAALKLVKSISLPEVKGRLDHITIDAAA